MAASMAPSRDPPMPQRGAVLNHEIRGDRRIEQRRCGESDEIGNFCNDPPDSPGLMKKWH
jgi:hypothetical protein